MNNLTIVDRAFDAGKAVEHYSNPSLKPLSKSNYLCLRSAYETMTECNAELSRLTGKVKQLEALIERIWINAGGRNESDQDDELPGIVHTSMVGNERLLARAKKAEAENKRLRQDNSKLAIETVRAGTMLVNKSNGCSTKELLETAQLTKDQSK